MHRGHTKLPTEAIQLNGSDLEALDDDQKKFMNTMYEHRVNNSTIASIMNSISGKGDHFVPKTLYHYHMKQKSENLINKASGITSRMTDAQKTLKYLEQ